MNDEEKLEETFDFNSGKTDELLRKAKLFTFIRTAAVSLLVFIVLSAAILVANAMLLNRVANSRLLDENLVDLVARPNTYTTHCLHNDGFLVGEAEFVTYRLVGGKPVYDGTYKIKYDILPLVQGLYGTGRGQLIQIEDKFNEGGVEFNFYSKVGNREMTFYHPYIEYEVYPNALSLLGDMGEDKCLELALSFDRGYSIEEVQAMLPEDVRSVWYWVDTYGEENLAEMEGHYADITVEGEEPPSAKIYMVPRVLLANEVFGIKAITSTGEKLEEPWNQFISIINLGLKKKSGRYHWVFENLHNALSKGDRGITADNIEIIGAVVTGDAASLKPLENNNHVRAASLGIVTDKF